MMVCALSMFTLADDGQIPCGDYATPGEIPIGSRIDEGEIPCGDYAVTTIATVIANIVALA